ncbi:hypothetical protein HDV01_000352 [Terramyces sp. JEL0728]|nr:hypothetical protein HDV01_000352 [Terramyces sp. JEL0728]
MNNFLSSFFNGIVNRNEDQSNSNQQANQSNANTANPSTEENPQIQAHPAIPGRFPVSIRGNPRRQQPTPHDNTPPVITFSSNSRLAKRIVLVNIVPPEIADMILNFAGVFKTVKFEKNVTYRGTNCDEKYLVTKPFKFIKIHKIRFRGMSKDQGWSSSDPQHHGTRNASCTWGEVYTDSNENVANNVEFTGERSRLYTNIHAGRNFEDHDIELDIEVAKGQVLVFCVRAMYPAWVHHIQHASIEFSYTD